MAQGAKDGGNTPKLQQQSAQDYINQVLTKINPKRLMEAIKGARSTDDNLGISDDVIGKLDDAMKENPKTDISGPLSALTENSIPWKKVADTVQGGGFVGRFGVKRGNFGSAFTTLVSEHKVTQATQAQAAAADKIDRLEGLLIVQGQASVFQAIKKHGTPEMQEEFNAISEHAFDQSGAKAFATTLVNKYGNNMDAVISDLAQQRDNSVIALADVTKSIGNSAVLDAISNSGVEIADAKEGLMSQSTHMEFASSLMNLIQTIGSALRDAINNLVSSHTQQSGQDVADKSGQDVADNAMPPISVRGHNKIRRVPVVGAKIADKLDTRSMKKTAKLDARNVRKSLEKDRGVHGADLAELAATLKRSERSSEYKAAVEAQGGEEHSRFDLRKKDMSREAVNVLKSMHNAGALAAKGDAFGHIKEEGFQHDGTQIAQGASVDPKIKLKAGDRSELEPVNKAGKRAVKRASGENRKAHGDDHRLTTKDMAKMAKAGKEIRANTSADYESGQGGETTLKHNLRGIASSASTPSTGTSDAAHAPAPGQSNPDSVGKSQ